MTRCAWKDPKTGERVCLRTDRHDCEVKATTRCTRTERHACWLGHHLPRREFGRAW